MSATEACAVRPCRHVRPGSPARRRRLAAADHPVRSGLPRPPQRRGRVARRDHREDGCRPAARPSHRTAPGRTASCAAHVNQLAHFLVDEADGPRQPGSAPAAEQPMARRRLARRAENRMRRGHVDVRHCEPPNCGRSTKSPVAYSIVDHRFADDWTVAGIGPGTMTTRSHRPRRVLPDRLRRGRHGRTTTWRCIAFTSGTTGRPKATMHFHRDLLAWRTRSPGTCCGRTG